MKKIGIYIIGGLIVAGIFFMGYFNRQSKEEIKSPLKYEILDSKIDLPEPLKDWLNKNKKTKGFYTKNDSKNTYVLISGGEQKTTGYGIGLDSIKEEKKKILVNYEIIKPAKNESVENKRCIPYMLLRVSCGNKKIIESK